MNKKIKQYEQIKRHGELLAEFFGLSADPVELCKKLRRIERASNQIMVDCCNGKINHEAVEEFTLKWMKPRLAKILGGEAAVIQNVYINGDPRGYTLKLNSIVSKRFRGYKDLGGYGILAPLFDGTP